MTIAIYRKKPSSVVLVRNSINWLQRQTQVSRIQIGQVVNHVRVVSGSFSNEEVDTLSRSLDHAPILISSSTITVNSWGVASGELVGSALVEAMMALKEQPVISCCRETLHSFFNGTGQMFAAPLKWDGGWLVADFDLSSTGLPIIRVKIQRLAKHLVYDFRPGAVGTIGSPTNRRGSSSPIL